MNIEYVLDTAYLLEVLFNIENKFMSGCHYYSQFKVKGGSKAQEGEATEQLLPSNYLIKLELVIGQADPNDCV